MRTHFFSSIAHELRTPLNSVIPILKLVLNQIKSSNRQTLDIPKVLRLLEIVHNSSIHLENVINDALDISRLENDKFEINKSPFEIRSMIAVVYDIMKFQIDAKGLQFKLNIKDNVPSNIHSDEKRIKQVLFNLIGNAVKFTLNGEISLNFDY